MKMIFVFLFLQHFLQSSMKVYNSDSSNHNFSKCHPITFLHAKNNTKYNIFSFTSHYLAYTIVLWYKFNKLFNLCSSFSSHLGGC